MTLIAVLLVSLLFTFVFVVGLRSKGPWGSGWTFFTITCLCLVAVSIWIPPAAPLWFGAPWIDLLMTGLLVSLMLSAISLDRASDHRDTLVGNERLGSEKSYEGIREKLVGRSLHSYDTTFPQHRETTLTQHRNLMRTGGLFWMLLLCLCALIIIGVAFPLS